MITRIVTLSSVLTFLLAIVVIVRLQDYGMEAELTLALAGIGLSIALVAVTALLVHESRELREAQSAPYISVTGRPSTQAVSLFVLEIGNHGGGSAREISFDLHGDLIMRDGRSVSSLRVFKHGIKYLEPGGKYTTMIGDSGFIAANLLENPDDSIALRVGIRYRSLSGRRYVNETWIEAREMTLPTPATKSIDDSLKRVDASLRAIEQNMRRNED